jgi:hypothetical protein
MNAPLLLVIALLLVVVTFFLRYAAGRSKVRDYLRRKHPAATIESISWTLLGPIAPGKNNIKFKVVMKNMDGTAGAKKVLYAVTSFFGDVYLNE